MSAKFKIVPRRAPTWISYDVFENGWFFWGSFRILYGLSQEEAEKEIKEYLAVKKQPLPSVTFYDEAGDIIEDPSSQYPR